MEGGRERALSMRLRPRARARLRGYGGYEEAAQRDAPHAVGTPLTSTGGGRFFCIAGCARLVRSLRAHDYLRRSAYSGHSAKHQEAALAARRGHSAHFHRRRALFCIAGCARLVRSLRAHDYLRRGRYMPACRAARGYRGYEGLPAPRSRS